MNVKWEDVKEDFARKDAEIESLKVMNAELAEALKLLSTEYCLISEEECDPINGALAKVLTKAKELNQ
jgi:hypothetical protein